MNTVTVQKAARQSKIASYFDTIKEDVDVSMELAVYLLDSYTAIEP